MRIEIQTDAGKVIWISNLDYVPRIGEGVLIRGASYNVAHVCTVLEEGDIDTVKITVAGGWCD
jgi:hypothetical protein